MDDCYLCRILFNNLIRRYGNGLTTRNFESFRTEVCWKQAVELEEKDDWYFVFTNPSCPRDHMWNWSHFFRMELWPTGSFSHHFDSPTRNESSKMSELSLTGQTSTRSPASQALAVSWFSQCRANAEGKHQECNRRDKDYLPKRLLDVKHARETSRLRVVSPELSPALFAGDREWMTLSHCWGEWGAKESPRLTGSNLESQQSTGLRMEDLPKTFQDSVEIAGWLGSKFIMGLDA